MLNITYDSSGQLIWFDANTGTMFTYRGGDIAWTLASAALVWIMVPGFGFYYSGLLRRSSGLSMLFLSMGTIGVVTFQWFFWGFSLAFSDTASSFVGNLQYIGLKGVIENPSMAKVSVPSLVYCVFELMFAIVTSMILVGTLAERARLGPSLVFIFIWSTLVYDPLACWTWNARGWSKKLGVLDFAGGTTVHISSGGAALAITHFLGDRAGFRERQHRKHNVSYVVLGTILVWFGWYGFNGGSALAADLQAAQAFFVTGLSASVGGTTWMLWEYRLANHRKWSVVGFCAGAVCSLIAITPGSGYVSAPAAVGFGVIAATACFWSTQLVGLYIDDALDIFASHAVGGLFGNVLTGMFAQKDNAALDGHTVIRGGWIDHNWRQVGYQLANSFAGFLYSCIVTALILRIMSILPALNLRRNTNTASVDEEEMGEFSYDYVWERRDVDLPQPAIRGNGVLMQPFPAPRPMD